MCILSALSKRVLFFISLTKKLKNTIIQRPVWKVLILSECAPPWGYPSPVGSSWWGYVQPPRPETAVSARAAGFTGVLHSKGDPDAALLNPS